MAILLRPVVALAIRMAAMTASVPELQKQARSAPVSSQIKAATSPTIGDRGLR